MTAVEFFEQGNRYFDNNQYQKAIESYNNAIKIIPEYEYAYYNRGTAKLRLKEYINSIEDFNKAIEINPNNPTYYNNRGAAYKLIGEFERARIDFKKKYELKDIIIPIQEGKKLLENKKYQEAIKIFTNVINSASQSRNYRKMQETINEPVEEIKINPKIARAYYYRGLARKELRKLENAIADFTDAIKLEEDNAEFYYHRGLTYRALSEKEHSILNINR